MTRQAIAAGPQHAPTYEELGITGVNEVSDLTPEEVMTEIERIVLQVASSILDGQACEYVVPNRSSSNQQYIPELDRIVLKGKVSSRPFLSVSSVRKVRQRRVADVACGDVLKGVEGAGRQRVWRQWGSDVGGGNASGGHHDACDRAGARDPDQAHPHHQARLVLLRPKAVCGPGGRTCGARGLYFSWLVRGPGWHGFACVCVWWAVVVGQTESDTILDDVACMASCTRTSLHVVASEKVRYHVRDLRVALGFHGLYSV